MGLRTKPLVGRWTTFFVGSLCTMLLAGCSDRDYALVEVSGVVTLDGKPLEGAHVTFQPLGSSENPNPGPGSYGVCDSEGRYRLTTVDGPEGAVVGNHRVSIRSRAYPEVPPASDVDNTPVQEKVPPWYNDKSILQFEVPAEGTTSADFQLSTRPPR